jgi:drug/metabolite transporter (DMT)-like permease
MKKSSNTIKGVVFAFITTLLWGFLPIILKIILTHISPLSVTWFRFFSASILIILYFLIKNPSDLKILVKPPFLLIVAAVCLGLNYLGFINGLHYTTPAIAEVFIQTGAILLAISGFVIFREKIFKRQLFGILLVFSGMALFYHDQIIVLAENVSRYQKGVFLTISGGVMWTCYAILQKGLVKNYQPLSLNLVLFSLPSIVLIPWVDFAEFKALPPGIWVILIFLGLNTLIAYGSLAYALKYLDANKVSVIITMNPIITFSALGAMIFFDIQWIDHEKFTWISVVGAFIVILGVVLTILKRKQQKSQG